MKIYDEFKQPKQPVSGRSYFPKIPSPKTGSEIKDKLGYTTYDGNFNHIPTDVNKVDLIPFQIGDAVQKIRVNRTTNIDEWLRSVKIESGRAVLLSAGPAVLLAVAAIKNTLILVVESSVGVTPIYSTGDLIVGDVNVRAGWQNISGDVVNLPTERFVTSISDSGKWNGRLFGLVK